MGVFVLSTNGMYVQPTELTLASAASNAAYSGKTIMFNTDQTLSANLNWPTDRRFIPQNNAKIIHGAYTIHYPAEVSEWPNRLLFEGTGAITGLVVSAPEWFDSGDSYLAFFRAAKSSKNVILQPKSYIWKFSTAAIALSKMGQICISGVSNLTTIQADWTGTTNISGERNFAFLSDDNVAISNVTFDGNKAQLQGLFSLEDNLLWNFSWFSHDDTIKIKKSDLLLSNVTFKNMPGSYTRKASMTGLLECFDMNVGVWDRVTLENIKRVNCDTTFHLAGRIHAGIDDEANWTTNVSVRNFRVYQDKTPHTGQLQGFGTYGVKRITIDGLYVEKARQHGLNFEWTEDAVANGVVVKDCVLAGIGGYGHNKNVIVNEPMIINCGTAHALTTPASIFTPQSVVVDVAPIRFVSGSWYTGGINGSPTDVRIVRPKIVMPATASMIVGTISTPTLTGALDQSSAQTIVEIGIEDIDMAKRFNLTDGRSCGNAVVVSNASYIPQTIDRLSRSGSATATPSANRDYFTLSASTQYTGIFVNLPAGAYAFSLRLKYVDSDWNVTASKLDGSNAVFAKKITSATPSGYVIVGGVFESLTDTQLKVIRDSTGAGSLLIKDLVIAPLRSLSVEVPSWFDEGIGATIVAATTISPTSLIFKTSGVTPIATINLPKSNFIGSITILPTAAFTTTTAGNIALASTAIVNKALTMTYDGFKWWPSY